MNGRAHTLLEIAPGAPCFVGDESRRRRAVEARVLQVFAGWDYQEILPPLYDYADTFTGALSAQTYSFVGRDGSLLALRPDFTSLLAKLAAGRLRGQPLPLRLHYSGEVLRYQPPKAGRQTELHQMGLELIGAATPAADAEVLAVAAECLAAVGAAGFVLTLGHVGVFSALSAGLSTDPATLERLRARIDAKDPGGARELLAGVVMGDDDRAALVALVDLAGDAGVLARAGEVCAGRPAALQALRELETVVAALHAAGLGEHVAIDLSEVRGLDYYTGLVFRAYAGDLGFEVGAGGRYDQLLARYGRPLPAVGFMLGLDRLMLLLERQGALPADPAVPAELVGAGELPKALAEARRLRAAGRRVRFGVAS